MGKVLGEQILGEIVHLYFRFILIVFILKNEKTGTKNLKIVQFGSYTNNFYIEI